MINILSFISYFPISSFFPFKLKFNFKISKILFFLLAGISLIFSLVLCIFQINSVIQKTYLLGDYEKTLSTLSEENKNLEISVSRANALESVESAIKDLNYKKVGEVKYIQLMEPQVVAK